MESSDRFFLLALSLPTSHVAYIFAFSLRCLGQPRKFIYKNEARGYAALSLLYSLQFCVCLFGNKTKLSDLCVFALSALSAHCLLKK